MYWRVGRKFNGKKKIKAKDEETKEGVERSRIPMETFLFVKIHY